MKIRRFNPADIDEVQRWFVAHGEVPPTLDMMPETSWIAHLPEGPALCVSLIMTNIKDYCYVDNFAGNPQFAGPARRKLTERLLKYIANYAAQEGYNKLLCLGYREPTKQYYNELGFTQTLDNVSTFIKEIA